jgi:hypothetical protein
VIKGKVFFAPPLHIGVGIFPIQIKDMATGLAFRSGFIGMKLRKEIVVIEFKPQPRLVLPNPTTRDFAHPLYLIGPLALIGYKAKLSGNRKGKKEKKEKKVTHPKEKTQSIPIGCVHFSERN